MSDVEEIRAGLDALVGTLESVGCGPVAEAETFEAPDGQVVLRFELTRSWAKLRALPNWLNVIAVVDATVGKLRHTDPMTRLNIRGHFPRGAPVVVVVPFHDTSESGLIDLVHVRIGQQEDIPGLMKTLATLGGA